MPVCQHAGNEATSTIDEPALPQQFSLANTQLTYLALTPPLLRIENAAAGQTACHSITFAAQQ